MGTEGRTENFHEHLAEIYNALAASALEGLVNLRDTTFSAAHNVGDEESSLKRDVVDYTRSAEDSSKQCDKDIGASASTHIIKGFYEIHQGKVSLVLV